jgi:membrane protein DedA with SNARE-associated domain
MESLKLLMSLLATSSLIGVFGATLLERLVPVLPSYLLLLGIGVAIARFDGSLTTAVSASLLGSVLGCWIYYYAASSIVSARARQWGRGLARWSGVSQQRMRRLLIAFRRNAPALALVSQLVPGLRLVTPGVAGALGTPASTYFPDSSRRSTTRRPMLPPSRSLSSASFSASRPSSARSGGEDIAIARHAALRGSRRPPSTTLPR